VGVRAVPLLGAPRSLFDPSILGVALLWMGLASPLVASLLGRPVLETALLRVGLVSPLVVIAVDAVTTLTKALAMSETASTGDAGRGHPGIGPW
jgi:hypothetical protein